MALRDEVLADNPLVYLEQEEQSGTYQDSSPNNRDADRISGGPLSILGVSGRCALGPGGIDIVGGFVPPTNNWTLMMWAAPASTIVVKGEGTSGTTGNVGDQKYAAYPEQRGSGGGMGLSIGTNAIQIFEHGDSYIPCLLSYVPGTPFKMMRFLCLHIVCLAKQYKLYVDGALVKTGQTSVRSASWAPYRFLQGGWGDPFNGAEDELAIWDSVLSDARIAAHSAAITTPRPMAARESLVIHHDVPPVNRLSLRFQDLRFGNTPRDPWPHNDQMRPGYWRTLPSKTRFPEES